MPRRRSLVLFGLGYAVLGLNVAAVLVYGPLYIRAVDPTRADLLTGLLFALPSLTAFVGYNLWGALYDRYPRPRPYVLASLGSEALFFTLFLAADSATALVALATTFALISTALFPVSKAWGTLEWEDSKGRIVGALHASESAGWGAASLAGAAICWWRPSELEAMHFIFTLCWIASVGAFAVMGVLFPRQAAHHDRTPAERGSLLQELAGLYGRPAVLRLALFLFVLTTANVAFFSYFSLYLCQHLGGSAAVLGLSMAGATIVGTLLFPVYGWLADVRGRRGLLIGATVAYVAFYAVLCVLSDPRAVAVLMTVPLYPAIRVGTSAWLADLTGERDRAGGMGLLEGVASLASVVGPVAGWACVHWLGYTWLPLVPLALLLPGICLLAALR
ncbi:MAG: MFS transporter [Candidatus Riflebacteria bacterium]|nr:MFS transporter [Candidatus Riflebacteria bacterium]